jgi:hypothetical protein
MNYFTHGRDALHDSYRLVGTAVPDMLNVVNRRCRMRSRRVEPLLADPDPRVAAIAAGVLEHLADDAWFHETRAFAELSMTFCRQLRDLLCDTEGFRPYFLGHILVELLLDSTLIEAAPERLTGYYAAMETVDADLIEALLVGLPGRWQTADAAEPGDATRLAADAARCVGRLAPVGPGRGRRAAG